MYNTAPQHFTIYTILFLDSLVALQAGLRRKWPRALLGVWEAGTLSLIGFQMGSHFHGTSRSVGSCEREPSLLLLLSASPAPA